MKKKTELKCFISGSSWTSIFLVILEIHVCTVGLHLVQSKLFVAKEIPLTESIRKPIRSREACVERLRSQDSPRPFQTIFEQKCSNLRPLFSIIFPQEFQISKNFGQLTLGSGGKNV